MCEYFDVNKEIVWDIVQQKLPDLRVQIEKIILLEDISDRILK